MVQKLKDNKKSIMIVAGALLACVIAIVVGLSLERAGKISELEKIKLTEVSDDVTAYLEYIEDAGNIDDYIIYALEYNYNVNDSTELSTKDMVKLLSEIFTKKITEEDIAKVGITPKMVDKNITVAEDVYKLNVLDVSYAEIASREVAKYNVKEIVKTGTDKYTVKYDKYVVENPYEVLNYYNDKGETEKAEEITKYLKGEAKVTTIKKYITEKNQSKVGKKDKTVTVKYVVKDKKVLIDNIK